MRERKGQVMAFKSSLVWSSRLVCVMSLSLAFLSGCKSPATPELRTATVGGQPVTPTARPVMTSYIVGELSMMGECLTVVDEHQAAYSLVWPPDVSASVEGDVVTITTGLVSGNVKVAQLRFGEQVFIGGGQVSVLDNQLKASIPEGCPSPYWVPGDRFEPVATELP